MKFMPFWIASIVLAAGGGWLASAAFTSGAAGREPRFPQLTLDHLSDAQRPLAEQIMKISSTGIGGPYNALLRSPVDTTTLWHGLASFAIYAVIFCSFAWAKFTSSDVTS